MSQDQHAGQNHSIKICNKSLERLAQFRYLGTTLTDHNCIDEEINNRLKSGNACSIIWCRILCLKPFKHRVKSHLPFGGIIRSSPYSPRWQDKG